MKETKKITIKEFCEQYKSRVPQMKEDYIKDNLVITPYVPFIKKDALAQKLVDISTYKYEDYTYTDDDDNIVHARRKTDSIQINSTVQYILFCRVIIENYTNLTVETEGFFEEYDLLKQSGLLNKLMIGDDVEQPLIPMDEIAEFRTIVDMKQKDILFNKTEVHNYVDSLMERFSDVLDVLAKPIIDKAMEQMGNTENVEGNDFLEVVK